MRLLRKMAVAITTAAICCTTVLPTIANAGTTDCSHDYKSAGTHVIKLGSYSDHMVDGKLCDIDRIETYQVMKCSNCGEEYTILVNIKYDHSICD